MVSLLKNAVRKDGILIGKRGIPVSQCEQRLVSLLKNAVRKDGILIGKSESCRKRPSFGTAQSVDKVYI